MIKMSDGNVILEVEEATFDLSNSSSYSEFLLWITNPDPGVVIRSDSFVVEESLTGEVREKAQRYADFLSEFVERRRVKLEEFKSQLPFDERRRQIQDFISELEG